jgi:hypothetical protein
LAGIGESKALSKYEVFVQNIPAVIHLLRKLLRLHGNFLIGVFVALLA